MSGENSVETIRGFWQFPLSTNLTVVRRFLALRHRRFIVSACLVCVLTPFAYVEKAASAGLACEQIFQGLRTSRRSTIQMLGLSNQDVRFLNRDLKEKMLRYPLGRPEAVLEKAIDKAMVLDPNEKKILLMDLNKKSPFSESLVNENLKLALGDSKVWKAFLNATIQEMPSPTTYFPVYGFWSHRVAKLSLPERTEILKLIGKFYDKARSSSDGHDSPKRDLDFLIHASLRGGEQILRLVDSGKSPLEAYDHYLKLQNELLLFSGTSKRGGYRVETVWTILKEIQEKIRERGYGPLLIGGSLTAGRANRMKSDVDYMRDEALSAVEERLLTESVRKSLREQGLRSQLTVERFPGEVGLPRDRSYNSDLATSNPVLFMVEVSQIQMWVYPTRFWQRGLTNEQTMFEPRIYILR